MTQNFVMQCSKCRSDNPDAARYCNQCGTFLDKTIIPGPPPQSFEEKFAKIQRYLPQGLTAKILTQRDRIEGERKHVTVMFCDMEGFMPLVERKGPEAAYTIMDEVYEILIQQVTDFEGTVNEMTGDGIMALFGAPIALEEAPQRALWAAHAIHREIAAYNGRRDNQEPIRMRIGVHSGPVIVGTLGNDLRVEFKAVGDTVNLASRMEHMAEPGTTYATRDVFKLARGMFKFEHMGKKVIKGRDESIQVYKVHPLRQDAHRPLLGAERMIFAEMVGRDEKLDQLSLLLLKLANGTGAVVNIVGEAGIGKSRLIAELKRREVAQRVKFLEGRAVSMGRNLSFHPLIDLLKQWARIGVEDGAFEAWDKLEVATQAIFNKQTEEVLPFIATLMGMNLPASFQTHLQGIEGEALEKLIRKNLRELFLRLSTAHPLVIVIDDLHWADESSIELLASLFRLAARARILFINIFRPGYDATGARVQQTVEAHPTLEQTTMVLEPLDAGTSQALIANMLDLKGVPPTLIGEIVRRTGGNPYFIEEVVRSFIDEGAVVVRNGRFEVTPGFSHVTIPHTINDVLMARIDRLEEETRDLLKVAAVIGRRFFYRILAEVAPTIRHLDERLSFLEEIQLIRERERMEELEYLFKHALAQEAAYASILPQKRKRLHLKVAATIENVFAEKLHAFYGMLAYHYSRGENLDQAEEALIKAGEEALKTSASSEALHYYREALLLYRSKIGEGTETEKAARLEKNIALALYNRGQFEEALEYFEKALGFFGGRLSHHPAVSAYLLISGLLHLLVGFYLPWLKFRKTPTERDKEVLDLRFKKMKALAIVQPKRFFIESMVFYKRIAQFNLTRIETGLGLFVGASTLFSFSGTSFWLSRKVLAFVNARIDRDDTRSYIIC
ncbi:MAG: adenylate/guanylate cyclase domain-containing protein, partial [Desulfobacterales bacterium]